MAGVPESAFSYLHRAGVIKNVSKAQEAASKPKVSTKSIAVQRPPEKNTSHVTKQGPREGHPAGKVKGTGANRAAVNMTDVTGDGWKPPHYKKRPNIGPETLGGATNSPGGNKARAAGAAKGVETKSASSDKNTHAAKRSTPDKAKLLAGHGKGGESAAYEKMEKRSLRGLKGGGTEKELREGHNITTSGPIAPRTGGGGGAVPGTSTQTYSGPGQIGSRVGMAGNPATQPKRRKVKLRRPGGTGIRTL